MCETKLINVCNKTVDNEIDIIEVDVDVRGNGKSWLISLLDKFKDSFVTDSLRTRVSTSQLEIRLIGSNITVQRSPYRRVQNSMRENKRIDSSKDPKA
jgi:hypothetical protein